MRLRRATAADWPALVRFYERHHAHRTRLLDERLWRWSFGAELPTDDADPTRAAPFPDADGQRPLPFFVLESGDEIVGGIGYLDGALDAAGELLPAGRPVNFFVDPAMRGLPSLRLLRAVQGERDVLVGAYVSDTALKLLTKSGFVDLSGALRDHRCTVAYGAARGAAAITAARRAVALGWRALAVVARAGVTYVTGPTLDGRVGDRFATGPDRVRFAKPERMLRWRYERSPLLRPRFVHQFVRGDVHGLAVLHVDAAARTAVLLDALTATADDLLLVALVERALRDARAAGVELVVTTCASARLERALRRLLFRSEPSSHGLAVLVREPSRRGLLTDASQWHFVLGDTDVY